jgi:hypothetical protein
VVSVLLHYTFNLLHNITPNLNCWPALPQWNPFVALFGGFAGIIALRSRERSHLAPGVVIATALMPPPCITGFGLAMEQWYFLLGAAYLFFIKQVHCQKL